jgi:hypothetical protein
MEAMKEHNSSRDIPKIINDIKKNLCGNLKRNLKLKKAYNFIDTDN